MRKVLGNTARRVCLFTVAPALCLVGACGDGAEQSNGNVEQGEQTGTPSWEDYVAEAEVTDGGSTYYVAEWDLFFPTEAALWEHYETNVLGALPKLAVWQQTSTGFEPTYPGNDARDIVYCVSTSFANQSTVIGDMAAAVRSWEDIANVKFRYDSSQNGSCNQSNGNVDFAVLPTTAFATAGCAANKLFWASAGGCRIGGVNGVQGVLALQYSNIPGSGASSGWTAAGVARHELGHILGFRHEHPWAPGQGGCSEAPSDVPTDTTGRRLTDYDQLSVMHYHACAGVSGADFNISALDGVGARKIYGMPASWYVPYFALAM
jgi:hypothetical protein